MQARLACAALYLTWEGPRGRAVEALACQLRQHMFGAAEIEPVMDWEACRMAC